LDCAIQYHIITNGGLPLEDFRIIHINGDYVKEGDIEIGKLFMETSVMEEVLNQQAYIREKIAHAVEVLSKDEIPEMPIGAHCTKPYPCDFRGYCWKNIPGNSVWYLPGISMQEKSAYFEKGITTIDELKTSDILFEKNKIVIEAYKKNQPYVQQKLLHDFLKPINCPLYFFDLEAFQPGIPVFDGTKPFERIPFLYSLHFKPNENTESEHSYYIGNIGEDPRRKFIEHFIADTERAGSIIVFNTLMEKGILNKLAEDFPEYRKILQERITRIIDMEIPFKNMWYYHPGMQGSYSLKTIAKAILEQDPFDSTSVKDGETAMAMYNELYYEPDKSRELKIIGQLIEYCKADTLALFKIFEKIKSISVE
jgi:hypothetical protein